MQASSSPFAVSLWCNRIAATARIVDRRDGVQLDKVPGRLSFTLEGLLLGAPTAIFERQKGAGPSTCSGQKDHETGFVIEEQWITLFPNLPLKAGLWGFKAGETRSCVVLPGVVPDYKDQTASGVHELSFEAHFGHEKAAWCQRNTVQHVCVFVAPPQSCCKPRENSGSA